MGALIILALLVILSAIDVTASFAPRRNANDEDA